DYRPMRDRRGEFEFSERSAIGKDGRVVRVRTARGTIHDPDGTINWRSTRAGGAADTEARMDARQGYGDQRDDVGHLIALWAGADPEEVKNTAPQNRMQNRSTGTYFETEQYLRDKLREHPGSRIEIEYTERYVEDPQRPRDRNMKAFLVQNGRREE